MILPLLVIGPIEPVLRMAKAPALGSIVPALLTAPSVPALSMPMRAGPPFPPAPPLMVAPFILVSDAIVAPLAFMTPSPPAPPGLCRTQRRHFHHRFSRC